MEINTGDGNVPIANVYIRLTRPEAQELIGSLETLLKLPDSTGQHQHISSEDYQTEVTVWLEE